MSLVTTVAAPRPPLTHRPRVRRNFDFKEKVEVDKYYPQFYHKTDKVCPALLVHRTIC